MVKTKQGLVKEGVVVAKRPTRTKDKAAKGVKGQEGGAVAILFEETTTAPAKKKEKEVAAGPPQKRKKVSRKSLHGSTQLVLVLSINIIV